jgi:pimeloyl-ACP methyl ester carboxylesterase
VIRESSGSGFPATGAAGIVFLPGLSGNYRQWDLVVPRVAGRGSIGFAAPILAHERFAGRRPSVTELAKAIADDLARWEPQSITLVSHSVGAFVALGIAHQIPQTIRGVVAVNGGLTTVARFIDSPLRELVQHPLTSMKFLRLFALVAAPVPSAVKKAIASRRWSSRLVVGGLVSDSALDSEERRQSLIVQAGKTETLLSLRDNRHHWNEFAGYAGQVTVPVVFVLGDRDPMTTEDDTRTMAVMLPNARIEVLHGVGHAAPLEAPEQVLQAIVGLASVRAP